MDLSGANAFALDYTFPIPDFAMSSKNPSPPRTPLSESYLADEDTVLGELIEKARLSPAEKKATEALASDLVLRMRSQGKRRGGIDAFTQEYALSSEEGVVLMCLAESLLRVPDAITADRLIRDKIGGANWQPLPKKRLFRRGSWQVLYLCTTGTTAGFDL